MKRQILYFLLVGMLLSSCSITRTVFNIQKRKYRKGYTVEVGKEKSKAEVTKEMLAKERKKADKKIEKLKPKEEPVKKSAPKPKFDGEKPLNSIQKKKAEIKTIIRTLNAGENCHPELDSGSIESNKKSIPKPTQEVHWGAKTAFSLPLITILLNALLIAITGSIPFISIPLSLLLAITSIIVGIKALRDIKSHQGNYKGRALIFIGFFFATLLLLFFGAVIVG